MNRATPSPRRGFRPVLEPLDGRDVPAYLPGAEVVVGADAGSPPLVRLVDPDSQLARSQFLAYEPTFYGGVRVAVADVTGDRYPDLVVAPGPGGAPLVKVYNGKTGAVAAQFFAFSTSFTGGVNIAAGDLNGDGRAEVIAGAGAGGAPQVTAFDGLSGQPIRSFFAYDLAFPGGVRVAAGDVDGDGRLEVITAPGFGGGPHVRIFTGADGTPKQTGAFFVYDPSYTGGLYVAAADTTGDGKAEIITGAGPTGGPQANVDDASGRRLQSFFAYDSSLRGGVRVGAADLIDGDGTAEVLTVAGPTGAAQVNVYDLPATNPAGALFAFPTDQSTGFFVDGSPLPLNIAPTDATAVQAAYDGLRAANPTGQPLTPAPGNTTVVVNQTNNYGGFGYPFGLGGFGLGGFGYPFWGPGFYDGFGLFAPLGGLYGGGFFGGPAVIDPGFGGGFDSGFYDTGYPDAGFYDGPVFADPGFADPGFGYFDDGFGDIPYIDDGYYSGGYGGFDDGFGGGFFDF